MADPTPYDIIQDNRLDALDELVHPYYQPPSETEHSFPVVGQGVSAEMYQQMSLAQGDGILITDDSENSYRLEGMPGGAAETNSTNRMVLKVSQNTGRSEAILRGFYHVLYQDMQIELPPVTTPTTYIIALTYDPRREEEPAGPIRVEVHQNTLPRTHGRKHIVLRTVHREPNQLLTEATLGRGRQNISPTITVVTEDDLPDPTDVLYGTIAIVRNRTSGGIVIPGTAQLFESRGIHGWHNLLVGQWQDLEMTNGWTPANNLSIPQYRHTPFGLQLRGRPAPAGSTSRFFARLPVRPVRDFHLSPPANPFAAQVVISVSPVTGSFEILYNSRGNWADLSWLTLDGLTIPLD